MPRYFVQLSYNGKNYYGWQIQPNFPTVQAELCHAFSTILRHNIEIVGCGRTDSGVHARNFVAHFDTLTSIDNSSVLCYKLNRFLPPDIVIHQIVAVTEDLHSRFSAISRMYRYFVSLHKDPFNQLFSYYYPYSLDVVQMNLACNILFEYDDFTSFSKLHSDVKHNRCKVLIAAWTLTNHQLVFEIRADRFLRNMVRAIVGTMLDVGRDKISLSDFRQIIERRDRGAAGQSVLPQGLFFEDVKYPSSIFS